MNGPDWLAEHSTGPIDPALAVLLVETWMRSDPDGQRRVWQLAHPHQPVNDEPVYKIGVTIPVTFDMLRGAGLWPADHDPEPGAWWTPLWPWRIGRTARTRLAIQERIIDTVHVARHGMPIEDDWL